MLPSDSKHMPFFIYVFSSFQYTNLTFISAATAVNGDGFETGSHSPGCSGTWSVAKNDPEHLIFLPPLGRLELQACPTVTWFVWCWGLEPGLFDAGQAFSWTTFLVSLYCCWFFIYYLAIVNGRFYMHCARDPIQGFVDARQALCC